ncbi:hypothetical protein K435DRAFT_747224 [Dendrothele bispora CBS 962.96]|uniref:Uncharacterized protein n=1 Tax=Dendrothele bispora (strain CBS 962.96) TaxID=1314807 RepID=A0A4S8MN92_DENBC|nr:hypothetical protein K435DRAFT_747224 [Dendrothele bispora CBS 962.96]
MHVLPVELLLQIQLEALSHSLPHISRRFYQVFKNAPNSFRAQYIFYRVLRDNDKLPRDFYTRILRYPLCSLPVLRHVVRYIRKYDHTSLLPPELPRRLFKNIKKGGKSDDPLPFLQVLYSDSPQKLDIDPPLPPPNPNSHSGYALTKAVQTSFVPLVDFLLSHGAQPSYKEGLSVLVAIRQKDLGMVKRLIERTDSALSTSPTCSRSETSPKENPHKRRKHQDRLSPTKSMLTMAVKVGAQDIIEYLMNEKGVVPDIKTLHLLQVTNTGNGTG